MARGLPARLIHSRGHYGGRPRPPLRDPGRLSALCRKNYIRAPGPTTDGNRNRQDKMISSDVVTTTTPQSLRLASQSQGGSLLACSTRSDQTLDHLEGSDTTPDSEFDIQENLSSDIVIIAKPHSPSRLSLLPKQLGSSSKKHKKTKRKVSQNKKTKRNVSQNKKTKRTEPYSSPPK